MLGGLVFASAIPTAFGERAVTFAWSYVALQPGRTLFMLWALRRHRPANYRNYLRVLAWLVPGALLWIAGAHGPQAWRAPCWIVGFLIEFASPWWGFCYRPW